MNDNKFKYHLLYSSVLVLITFMITSSSNASGSRSSGKIVVGSDVIFNSEDISNIENRLGTADISSIGDGTVNGAINEINNSLDKFNPSAKNVLDLAKPTPGVWTTYTMNGSLKDYHMLSIAVVDKSNSFSTYIIPISMFKYTTVSQPLGGTAPQSNGAFGLCCYVSDTKISVYRSTDSIGWLNIVLN